MSCYEGLNGRGVLSPERYVSFRRQIIETYNRQIVELKEPLLSEEVVEVPLGVVEDGQFYQLGYVELVSSKNEFFVEIDYENHAVSAAEDSPVYHVIDKFVKAIPNDDPRYGACLVISSEYDDGEGAQKSFYGGWRGPNQIMTLLRAQSARYKEGLAIALDVLKGIENSSKLYGEEIEVLSRLVNEDPVPEVQE